MRVLVFNAGSSSLKLGVFDGEQQVFKASFDRFGPEGSDLKIGGKSSRAPQPDLAAAIAAVPALLDRHGVQVIDAVGHRLAHGGTGFTGPVRIDDKVIDRIDALTSLAPLHNPAMLQAVRMARQLWPDLPQVAVFDTSFHLTNPARATTYAVPKAWREAGLRRFGFHGTSHRYVAARAAEALGQRVSELRIVSIHLGNGASACAVQYGRSIDSSMGMTPLEGLVMGTRSGDVDPGAFGFLQRELGLDIPQIEAALYESSGLKALTGSPDMRDVEDRAAAGDADAQLAINIYAYRARKYLGAYAAAMGGLDAVVFTGGIGENSASMRRRICDGFSFLGLILDEDLNRSPDLTGRAAPQIQAQGSRVAVIVTETAEQLMIAREVRQLLVRTAPVPRGIPVAVSGRHVHLSAAAVEALFGAGYRLTPAAPLRQPGNWVAQERILLEGPKGRLERVAILGPLRPRTQIEVSRTDSFTLGLDAPVRDSGRLDGTPTVRLIGPAGQLDSDGLIVAARHIHTNPADAEAIGLADGSFVHVRVTGASGRDLVFDRVLIRVAPGTVTEMHIDTDEANAAGISGAAEGELAGTAVALALAPR
ncbi:acetate/propionate family kinase [Paracoccus sp. R12_1]|uniref:acetate/propionate family kinase n=1 Tax=unclassified Paracoccus (in: a-proteobacteria) TaxID=2688777 RepID=UPI001ADD5E8E|nr:MULTISPECIES: acetate/propionate family kinase [unclassified Paracoccus (in: a-proteobacteria)]MBO9456236.1 acetate/propionate family kinase [Paracoccus sp. R12_2]MBO9487472.1 acetate/propionate family kinase [Paracoccus sp. R12_1]